MADAGALSGAQKDALALYFNQQLNPTGTVELNQSTGMIDVNAPQQDAAAIAAAKRAAALKAHANPLLASMNTLETVLANKNQQSNEEYGRAIDGYDSQDALDRAAYDRNTQQNEQTFTSNNQAALLNAANASTGLRGVLGSLGGLAGDGIDVVRRLVGLAANQDSGASRNTFETNATNLNTAWSQAEQDQRQRRADAKATLDNSLQNNEASVLTSRQSILQQLANLYGADSSEGQGYASEATALAPRIAATTKASVAPYAKASSSFSPGALQEYLAGTQNLNVSSSSGDTPAINSPIFSTQKKKETLSGVA